MLARGIKEGTARGDRTAVQRVPQQVSRHVVLEESGEIHKVHPRPDIDADQHVFRHRRVIMYMRIVPKIVFFSRQGISRVFNKHPFNKAYLVTIVL